MEASRVLLRGPPGSSLDKASQHAIRLSCRGSIEPKLPASQTPGTQATKALPLATSRPLSSGVTPAAGCAKQGSLSARCASTEVDPAAGVELYNPKSYDVLIKDATKAVERALDSGLKRLEVEFPPLPSSISGYEGASDDFIAANIQLALRMAQQLKECRGLTAKLVLPDQVEVRQAARRFRGALQLTESISLGSLEDGGATKGFFGQLKTAFDFDFDFDAKEEAEKWASTAPADVYIVTNVTTTELPGVEAYVEKVAGDAPVILFNLELDTLRADLGLFGFPSKDVHYKFLTQFLPAFYIRLRDYSKSVPVAPFILNYSGALLRQYPGPWQVMIKQSDGSYACVAEAAARFTLGEAKEELMTSLGLQEEDGSALQALRRGYKTSTWWEEETDREASTNWRS